MKRSPAPKRKTPLQRSKFTPKRRKASQPLKKARALAVERAGGLCEARWDGCGGLGEHAHHIRRRSQGGADTADNLLIVCHRCHSAIHSHPTLASRKGHLKLRKET